MYREDTPNVARSLKGAGYRTGLIGKLHVNPESAFPFDFEAVPTANFQRKDLTGYARHAASFMGASDEPFFLSVNYPDAHQALVAAGGGPAERTARCGLTCGPIAYLGLRESEIARAQRGLLQQHGAVGRAGGRSTGGARALR